MLPAPLSWAGWLLRVLAPARQRPITSDFSRRSRRRKSGIMAHVHHVNYFYHLDKVTQRVL